MFARFWRAIITTPRNPWLRIARIPLLVGLWALPFALFFWVLFGDERATFLNFYKVSLVFAGTIALCVTATGRFLVRHRADGSSVLPIWAEVLSYVFSSLIGSFAGATIIHFTLVPGFLGSPRAVLVSGAYALLFTILVTGLIYAWQFYRQAIERARAEQELSMARRIQRSFLLSQFPSMPGIEIHALNVSSREVSGDFYDVVPAGDRALLLAIADVAGKGVPAALMTSMLQASLRTQAPSETSAAAILRTLNGLVYRSTAVHQFATCVVARLDEATLSLRYANAGHNPPQVYRRDGTRVSLDCGGTVVGILDGVTFEESTVALRPGDRVVLYTDGVSEAEAPGGELFGDERVHALVEALPHDLTAAEILQRILADVTAFVGRDEFGDDVTLMAIRVLDGPGPNGAQESRTLPADNLNG